MLKELLRNTRALSTMKPVQPGIASGEGADGLGSSKVYCCCCRKPVGVFGWKPALQVRSHTKFWLKWGLKEKVSPCVNCASNRTDPSS